MSMSNTPQIRFAGFTDAWEERKFGEMFERRMERNNGQFDKTKWISVAKMYFQEPEKVTSNNIDTRTYVLRKGDIAFEGHSNKEYAYGRFVANDIGDGVISELFPIYKHIDKYDLYYWKYAIQIERIMAPILLNCIEISYTSSNKLDENFFLKESVLVPSLDEQQKIGDLFANLDNLITLHQRKCDTLKALKKAMLQKMFPKEGASVPEIRFAGFTDDWEQRKLGDVCKMNGRIGFRGYTEKDIITKEAGGVLTFSPTNIIDNQLTIGVKNTYITKEKYEESPEIMVKDGNILFVKTGSTLGKSALVTGVEEDCTVNPQMVVIKVEKELQKILSTLLTTDIVQSQIASVKIGGAVPTMTETELKNISFYIPASKEEQTQIGSYFKNLDTLITLHQRKLDTLQKLKKAMLQKMYV